MAAEFTITGLDRLVRKFKLLPQRIGNNAARRAMRKGANVTRDQARTNASRVDDSETSEMIAKNIVTQAASAKRSRQAGGILMRVGVMGGARGGRGGYERAGNPGGDTWYWRLVEFGSSEVAARPFMRPAMNSTAGQVFSVTGQAMGVEFDKEMRKLEMEP